MYLSLLSNYMKNLKFIPPIVFNISKIKIVCKRIGQMYFHLQLENQFLQIKGFWQNHKGNYVPLFNVPPSPNLISVQKKKAHIAGPNFFQTSYCWFLSEYFTSTFTNPAPSHRYCQFFSERYGYARHAWPHQQKLYDQIVASMDTLLNAKNTLSTSSSFWDIKI